MVISVGEMSIWELRRFSDVDARPEPEYKERPDIAWPYCMKSDRLGYSDAGLKP